MNTRNQEFEEAVTTHEDTRLRYFVEELNGELDDIGATLDTESSKMLLNWVRDKVRALHEDFIEDQS